VLPSTDRFGSSLTPCIANVPHRHNLSLHSTTLNQNFYSKPISLLHVLILLYLEAYVNEQALQNVRIALRLPALLWRQHLCTTPLTQSPSIRAQKLFLQHTESRHSNEYTVSDWYNGISTLYNYMLSYRSLKGGMCMMRTVRWWQGVQLATDDRQLHTELQSEISM
jgi:hypothetical protein